MGTVKVERKALAEVREYAALVSSADAAFEAIGQLYRDRTAGENSFDELKNQGRWGSCTTLAREHGKRSARAVALNDDGRRGRVRLAHAEARLDAITRRPLLVAGVARIGKGLDPVRTTAPGLPKAARWSALVRGIAEKVIAGKARMPRYTALAPPALAADFG